jgi:hypothetical protein
MEMSGQLHAPAALPPGKEPLVPIGQVGPRAVLGSAIKLTTNSGTIFSFRRKVLGESSLESTHVANYIILLFTINLDITF